MTIYIYIYIDLDVVSTDVYPHNKVLHIMHTQNTNTHRVCSCLDRQKILESVAIMSVYFVLVDGLVSFPVQ